MVRLTFPNTPNKTQPAPGPAPTFPAVHCLSESRDSGLGSEGGVQKGTKDCGASRKTKEWQEGAAVRKGKPETGTKLKP